MCNNEKRNCTAPNAKSFDFVALLDTCLRSYGDEKKELF